MITQEKCPIMAEISTFVKIYLFVISMIGRHGVKTKLLLHLYILPKFGDFGAKMSFFHYIVNQKRNNFIKHRFPRVVRRR